MVWSLLLLPTSPRRSTAMHFLPLQKILNAQFALLSIERKIHYVFCHRAATISTPHASTYGFSSNLHAQFVGFPYARLLRKSALCSPCLVQLSDLNTRWTLWMSIQTNARHLGRGFLQGDTTTRERTPLQRAHQMHKRLRCNSINVLNRQRQKGIFTML
ncbi:uncharacterized protein LOC107871385 isoform X2 [Capsicum annuum]|uniref:uncharacterized protein LOC107871385 isoform X2 n=1 Tax=Capsicum annuum TaxID=4072 RepID=UPI001FB09AF9|nr:uncharacterized protein LOC107871385 isoform X2 [Capsicum annuum]XP_047268793.1 uncharacterized protein LOC107871385 isoform X2 [Capsicum annuum]